MRAHTGMKCGSPWRGSMWGMVSEIHSTLDFGYHPYPAESLVRLRACAGRAGEGR